MLASNFSLSSRSLLSRNSGLIYIRCYSSKPPKTDTEIIHKRRIPGFTKAKLNKLHGTQKSDDEIKAKEALVNNRKLKKLENDKNISKKLLEVSKGPKYIPLKNFPTAPQSLLDLSLDELYQSINLKPVSDYGIANDENSTKDKDNTQEKTTFVDFSIPDKYLKSQVKDQVTAKDKAIVEELDNFIKSDDEADLTLSQLNMIKLYYDQESNSYQPLPEHTLKKSLLGMINLNPALVDIDDEFLWNIIPRDKLFGKPPFEMNMGPNAFKDWEKQMLEKERKERDAKEIDEKEYKEFEISLNKAKSFFKKSGGRKKLDKQLMKQYKRLKKEGKIPKDFNLNFNDDD